MSETDSPQTELMAIFDFTADDLAANRQGQMTERQVRKMRSSLVDTVFGIAGSIAIFVAIIGIDLLTRAAQIHPELQKLITAFVIVSVLCIPIVVVILVIKSLTTMTDFRKRIVRSFMCDFSLKSYRSRSHVMHYELQSCGKRFPLTKKEYESLCPVHVRYGKNSPYRFYLADSSGNLLSMELIPE